MTIRPSLRALGFYIGWSFGGSVILYFGALALAGHESASNAALVGGWILFLLFLLPVASVRCRLEDGQLYVHNYFRSYSLPWNDISAIELVPAAFFTVDTSWSVYPRCRLRSGKTVDIRALIHMRRQTAKIFEQFVDAKAVQFGFTADINTEALTH
jgi:hypothetical protein